jgi:hypothetical protein
MTAGFPDSLRQKICPRCGGEFGCGPQTPNEACWCDALPHVAALSEGGDCFCPVCLADICKAAQRNAEIETDARGSR